LKEYEQPELYLESARTARWTPFVSVIETDQLMHYTGIISVCSEIRRKFVNKLRGQNVELLNVKPGGI